MKWNEKQRCRLSSDVWKQREEDFFFPPIHWSLDLETWSFLSVHVSMCLCCVGRSAGAAPLLTCINAQPCPRLICHSRCIFAFILICASTLDQPPIYPRRRSHLIDFVHYRWVAARPPTVILLPCRPAFQHKHPSEHEHNTSSWTTISALFPVAELVVKRPAPRN